MIVLVAGPVRDNVGELVSQLLQQGHTVHAVPDIDVTLKAIAADFPDVVLLEHVAGSGVVAAAVRALNELEPNLYRHVLALVADDTAAARDGAYEVGADDVAFAGTNPRELIARVRSAERIIHLERRLRERVIELESAVRRLELSAVNRGQTIAATMPGQSAGRKQSALLTTAWDGFEDVLQRMCSEYLQMPLASIGAPTPPVKDSPGVTISLTDVEHELRVDLAFFAAKDHARSIAAAFCGDPDIVDDEIIKDVMLELANSGMGAIKAAFLSEEFRFAGSIPKVADVGQTMKLLEGAQAKRVLCYAGPTAAIHVVATLRHQGKIRIVASKLIEGMVLASDVMTDKGVLLARSGTRLTETSARMLARQVPTKEIELANAA